MVGRDLWDVRVPEDSLLVAERIETAKTRVDKLSTIVGLRGVSSRGKNTVVRLDVAEDGTELLASLSRKVGATVIQIEHQGSDDTIPSTLLGQHTYFKRSFTTGLTQVEFREGVAEWRGSPRLADQRGLILAAEQHLDYFEGTLGILDDAMKNPDLNPEFAAIIKRETEIPPIAKLIVTVPEPILATK